MTTDNTTETLYIKGLLGSLYKLTNVESLFYLVMDEYVNVAHKIAEINRDAPFDDLCLHIARTIATKELELMNEAEILSMFAVVTAYIGRYSTRTEGQQWLTFNTPTGSPTSTARSETATTNTSSDSSDQNKTHKTP